MTQKNETAAGSTEQPPSHEEIVQPEWIDYNGHMNVAYYLLAFDHAADALLDTLELGVQYRNEKDCSLFAVETHITYQREVLEGDRLAIATRILSYDSKRLHLFHEMYHVASGDPVATNEVMLLHVNMVDRRASGFPSFAVDRIESVYRFHQNSDMPSQAGRAINVLQALR